MTVAVAIALFVACSAGLYFGGRALMAWQWRRLWRPAGGDAAVAYACARLGIVAPAVYWIRGEYFTNAAGVKAGGQWVPGRITIAVTDGQPWENTGLPLELGRESRFQHEHVRDASEPPHLTPELEALREQIGDVLTRYMAAP